MTSGPMRCLGMALHYGYREPDQMVRDQVICVFEKMMNPGSAGQMLK